MLNLEILQEELIYRENFLVLRDDIFDIVRQCELSRAKRVRHQVVVVHEIIAP
jgi:hypothetical protein